MGRKRIDLTGQKFGRLAVVEEAGRNKSRQILWKCKCDCGKEKIIAGTSLTVGKHPTRSCGCLQIENMRALGRSRIGHEPWNKSKLSKEEYKRARRIRTRRHQLKKKYNITTVEEWYELWKHQGGLCAICERPLNERSDTCVDHDHLTGRNRGLLHKKCNLFLGLCESRIKQIPNVLRYLGG